MCEKGGINAQNARGCHGGACDDVWYGNYCFSQSENYGIQLNEANLFLCKNRSWFWRNPKKKPGRLPGF